MEDGNTEPEGLAIFLSDPQHQDFLGNFECIVFKSCYTANSLNSDEKFELQKKAYNEIKAYIHYTQDRISLFARLHQENDYLLIRARLQGQRVCIFGFRELSVKYRT